MPSKLISYELLRFNYLELRKVSYRARLVCRPLTYLLMWIISKISEAFVFFSKNAWPLPSKSDFEFFVAIKCVSFFSGPPGELVSCALVNQSATSLAVSCEPGHNGGLQQRFSVQVRPLQSRQILFNLLHCTFGSFER